MLMKTQIRILLATALVAGSAVSVHAQATLLNDTFADGDRTTQNLPASAAHYFGTSTANGNIAVTSNALQFGYTGTTNTLSQVVSYFTPGGSPVALSVGDTLTASFTLSGTAIANAADTLRIGLYNSGGTRVSADTSGIADAAFNSYTGYGLWANMGTGSNSTDLVQRTSSSTTLFAGGAHSNVVSSTAPLGYSAATTYTLTFEIEYTSESSVSLTFTDSNGYSKTAVDTSGLVTSFDTFALFLGSGSVETAFTVDNIHITTTSIPEPSSVATLAGLGVLGLVISRRRRAA